MNSLCRRQWRSLLPKTADLLANQLSPRFLQQQTPSSNIARYLQHEAKACKPAQPDDRLLGSPDTSLLRPELQQQWAVERNMHLGAIRIKPQSNLMTVWQCDKCPAGQPQIWTARVTGRTRGRQCPYCSNRLVCLHNALATIAPDVAQYWNHSKNEKVPEQVLAGSHSQAEWRCPACNLEWQAPICVRTRSRSGCPGCSRATKVVQSQHTFFEAQPACLDQWDHKRNSVEGIYPDNTKLGSRKLVHWVCSCCPRGQPHRWTAAPHNRIANASGCAVCAGRQACVCNSLKSLFPWIAHEFDVDKNGFAPSEVTAYSGKEVWWRTAKRGSWRQKVSHRTHRRRNELYLQPV